MICRNCGTEFYPDPDTERLMMLGQIAMVCDVCARKNAPPPPMATPVLPAALGNELCRAEFYDAGGKLLRFIALPPKREWRRVRTLRKPRKSDVAVFVMTERASRQTSHPPIRISSNIETFERLQADFWVMKTPGFWDGFTGVSRIDVPFVEIIDVKRNGETTELFLRDGAKVRLRYR